MYLIRNNSQQLCWEKKYSLLRANVIPDLTRLGGASGEAWVGNPSATGGLKLDSRFRGNDSTELAPARLRHFHYGPDKLIKEEYDFLAENHCFSSPVIHTLLKVTYP